jgi:hypothetical protein
VSVIVSSPAGATDITAASRDAGGATAADEGAAPGWTRWFTRLSVVAGLIALAVTVWSVGPAVLWGRLLAIGIGFGAIIAIEAAVTGCDAAALSGFLGGGGRRPGYWYVLRAQVIGRAINAVTPLASLGEATKATTLMERTSTPRAIGAVMRYNLATLGVRLAIVAIGAPICALVLDVPIWLAWLLVGGAAVSAALLIAGVVLVKRGMLSSAVSALRTIRLVSAARAKKWGAKLKEIDRHLRPPSGGDRRARWTPAAWVVVSRSLTLTSAWLVLVFTGQWVSFGTVAAISSAGQIISVASSLVPLGLGVSEAGNAALFAALGESASLGVAMVLGTRITTLVYAAIGLTLMGTATVIGSRR